MKKALLLTALFSIATILQAGFIDVVCTFDDDPQSEHHDWGFVAAEQKVWLVESYKYVGSDSVTVSGVTNEDPDLWMTKSVKNENGHIWTAYSLTLSGNAAFVSASSDLLPDVSLQPQYVLFSGGTVEQNETLNMSFTINVPASGNFSFCLTQLAIPEPASLALLGLGGLTLLRRK